MTPEQTKLNMGCGFRKADGFWNVDKEESCNPDQVLDLETFPWPYEDNFFEKIMADNVLEHLGSDPRVFDKVIQEMYRVSQDKAEWFINIPHHRCDNYYDDYTHVRMLTSRTFNLFDQSLNHRWLQENQAHSTHGLRLGVDIEIKDQSFNMIGYWLQQVQDGIIGNKQLDINLNTLNNVAESVNIFCTVHKPGRYQQFYTTTKK